APPPAPPPVTVTPPRLVKDEGAEYPASALREGFRDAVQVTVVLEIGADGKVTKAAVEAAVGHGFDEAAVAAAARLVFAPAQRNGRPVASKIKHVYAFTPPASRLVGKVLTSTSDRPIGGAEVILRAPDGVERRTTTAPDGSWSFAGVGAGAYR